jgi:hypothetical protein
VTSLETQIEAVFLPAGFHARTCGRLCLPLRPAPLGSLVVSWVRTDRSPREIGVFGAFRDSAHRWLVALVTADRTWFHGEYTDARLLRQFPGPPAQPLQTVLTAELIVLR